MNEALTLSESDDVENEEKAGELRAREIAESGNYTKISETLSSEGLLDDQIKRVQEVVGGDIEFLTQKDWEMLTVLELFDVVTFEHCLKTHEIAKDKIERVLDDDVVIADFIRSEVINIEKFYRACLLHDIGKVEIPKPILNKVFHEDWDSPAVDVLDEADIENVRAMGFDVGRSSNEIMKHHERSSEKILSDVGLRVEAILVGQHHNYEGKSSDELKMPLATSALCISLNLADIMHLADVQQAMEQERPYKQREAKINVLAVLVSHAKQGLVDKYITYLWVKDELKDVTDEEIDDEEMKKNIEFVNSFLDSHDQS
jgi:HD-GYP domain-containing protein (c-di-GMP phosphodiesterase class II)